MENNTRRKIAFNVFSTSSSYNNEDVLDLYPYIGQLDYHNELIKVHKNGVEERNIIVYAYSIDEFMEQIEYATDNTPIILTKVGEDKKEYGDYLAEIYDDLRE